MWRSVPNEFDKKLSPPTAQFAIRQAKVLAVNLVGPFRLTALMGTRMVEGGGGSIINVSSIGAIRPYGGIVPYAAAKAGVNAMTVAFAQAFPALTWQPSDPDPSALACLPTSMWPPRSP